MIIYNDEWIKDRRRATVIPQHGCADNITEGKRLFDAPTLLFQSTAGNVPKELENEPVLFTDSFLNIGMQVTKAGWVLIVIEREPEVATPDHFTFYLNHQVGGFKKLADFEDGELLPAWQAPLSLWGKYCEVGTDFQSAVIRGALSVFLVDIDESYTPQKPQQLVEENLRLSYLPSKHITGDELKDDMEYYRPYNRGYQACPTVTSSKNGTLFAAIMADPYGKTFCNGENYYGYIPIMRSRDGINWENPITVFDPDKEGPMRVYEPVLWFDGDRLYLSYSFQVGHESNYSGMIGTWITYCDNPEDEAPIWSEPKLCFEGMTDDTPVKAANGKWYWISYFSRHFMKEYYTEEQLERGNGQRVYVSDNLLDWDYICSIEDSEDSTSENSMIEVSDGTFLIVERHESGTRYNTISVDNPRIRAGYKILRYDNRDEQSPQMQNVYSRNCLYKLNSGNIILTYHDNDTRTRNNLTVALSKDGGITWPYKLLLDARLHSSYAFITQTPNNDIHIIYDQGRGRSVRPGSSEILIARLTEEDIIAGKCVTPRSVIKRLVSRYEECPREDTLKEQLLAAERIMAANGDNENIKKAISAVKENYTLDTYIALCEACDKAL